MGSVANPDVTIPDAVIPKREASIEEYTDSSVSSPDPSDIAGVGSEQANQEPTPAPKRKGGRKPVSHIDYFSLTSRSYHPSDLCYVRRTQTKKSPSTSCLSRTTNRVHQAT